MDRILIIMKKMDTRESSALLLGLFSIIWQHVYLYIQHYSGERLQDHWSSGFSCTCYAPCWNNVPLKTNFENLVCKISQNVFELAS